MGVLTLRVPTRAQMGYGIGKAIQYGVEYEVLNDLQVELTCGDEIKLAKMKIAFCGEIVSYVSQKNVRVDAPRHETGHLTVRR